MPRKRKDNIGDDDLEGYDSSFDDDELDSAGVTAKRSRKSDLTEKDPAPIVPSGSSKGVLEMLFLNNFCHVFLFYQSSLKV